MQFRSALLVVPLLGLVGCGAPPQTVTTGKFASLFTLTMQRGSADVLVLTADTGTYTVTNYNMDHPMGSRPDTEATFTTSAGTFTITDKGVPDGLLINGTKYTYNYGPNTGRITITIDTKGVITVDDPNAKGPNEEAPKPKAKD